MNSELLYIMLFIIGISLVILNALAIKREKRSFKNTFQIAESDITETDIRIGELRREFAETITELQSEIIYLKELIESFQNNDSKLHNDNNEVKVVEKSEVNNELKDSIMDELKEFYYNNAENLETSYNKNILLEKQSVEKQENTETSSAFEKYEDKNNETNESHCVESKNMESSSNNLKIEDVRNLFDKGLNVDEIASQLNIGKGEVLLIKELYLR